tara:strand:+ start:1678 stop:2328 length:651 start_codon:yes stop_codon:yes gene_type:complete
MNKIKYPRTPHLPWSKAVTSDDLIQTKHIPFLGKTVVVTEKMDGENTTLYPFTMHARSLDSGAHDSRSWVKAYHARIQAYIPYGWRICGENMYARHAISYTQLKSYFYAFSVWNEHNQCLSWKDTVKFCQDLDLVTPNVLYQGPWCEATIRRLKLDIKNQEGYVVRIADAFSFKDFTHSVAKWVRPHHVQQSKHWMYESWQPNGLVSTESIKEGEG